MIYHSHLVVKPSQNLAGTWWHTDGGFQHAKTPVSQPQEKPPAQKEKMLSLACLSRRRIGKMIADLGRQIGITDVRCSPHTFRHTCATNLLRGTRDLRGVKTFLGHSTVIVTEKYLQTFSSEDAPETHEKAAIADRLLEL